MRKFEDKVISYIINPAAGFGKTKKKLRPLIKAIRSLDRRADILITRHPLHAIGLAKEAQNRKAERIVVIGGDGTLNEVVNGYFDRDGLLLHENTILAMVPSGTGSDFYRNLETKKTIKEAIELAITGPAKSTDIGLVVAHDANAMQVSRYFINVSSTGLSGLVAGFMKTVTRVLGAKMAYFIATVQAIKAFDPPTLRLISKDGSKTIEDCSLISVANGKFFGSGMKIAPNALLNDGLLDVVTIEDLGAMQFLRNSYRVYQGTHLTMPNVHEFRHASCRIESFSALPVYIETDGELFAELPAEYSIKPNAIKVVR
jgi:diacylglycerol kinase (ATP)